MDEIKVGGCVNLRTLFSALPDDVACEVIHGDEGVTIAFDRDISEYNEGTRAIIEGIAKITDAMSWCLKMTKEEDEMNLRSVNVSTGHQCL